MPNIANVFKSEISRIARKELRGELEDVKKAITSYRAQIAELKQQVKMLQREVKTLARRDEKSTAVAPPTDGAQNLRFSAKGLASQRQRLGLSVVATAKILGVSPQSVTNWESGTTRPRANQLEAIASLRKMGKKDVAAKLAT